MTNQEAAIRLDDARERMAFEFTQIDRVYLGLEDRAVIERMSDLMIGIEAAIGDLKDAARLLNERADYAAQSPHVVDMFRKSLERNRRP